MYRKKKTKGGELNVQKSHMKPLPPLDIVRAVSPLSLALFVYLTPFPI